jgi:hypothetical protein
MKFLIGYAIWNKADMIAWIMYGLIKTVVPARADVLFVFDNCVDDSLAQYQRYSRTICWHGLDPVHGLQFLPPIIHSGSDLFESRCHNLLLEEFRRHPEYDALIVLQDDQCLQGKTLFTDIERAWATTGPRLAIIGGRDGYGKYHSDMVSSKWSESPAKRRLEVGETAPCLMLNRGPTVYFRAAVAALGLLDADYYHTWFMEEDYCLRAASLGWQVLVMGTDVVHDKFGQCLGSKVYEQPHPQDRKRLNARWGPHV